MQNYSYNYADFWPKVNQLTEYTTFTLEYRLAFLFEEWNEPYLQYGEVNTAEEKVILCQEPCPTFYL